MLLTSLYFSRGDRSPPGYPVGSGETAGDTPLAPARQGRLGTRVPRQRDKSPAELDFYGEFNAACCGRPVLPVPALPECGRRCFGFHSEEIFLWEKKSPELI